MMLLFIDGNHDNHTNLRLLPVGYDGLATVRPHIRYLPRGGRAVVGGLTVGGLGGAFSLDFAMRVADRTWWPGIEEAAAEDVEKLISGGPVDILLTHDVPSAVGMTSSSRLSAETESRARSSRNLLQGAVDALRPPDVFCGHWHQRNSCTIEHSEGTETRVHVLGMDGDEDGHAVLLWPGTPLRVESLHMPYVGAY